MTKKLHYSFKVETVYDRRIPGWLTFMLIILLYFGGTSSMHAINGSDNFNSVEDSKTIEEDLTVYAKIVRSYNITDASTEDKVCFPTKGKGVIFQRAEGCQGSHHIWRVADKLTMNEYDNDTATIVGSVIDDNGKIGKVNITLYNKSDQGNTWEAQCYQEGITDPRTLYQSFNGTITVDGKSYSVELKQAKQHYIIAEGAGFEPGQFGFGAWTGGSFGGCTEWFGNLDPIVNCNLTVESGNGIETCNEETVELTAIASGISECVGGCEYPIERTPRCHDSSNLSDVWLANITGKNSGFVTSSSKFETLDDGTARYTAIGSNGLDNIEVDVTFSGYTKTAPQGSPKENNCETYDTSNWAYWTHTSGTIKTDNHGTLIISRAGPSMQLGNGADVTRTGFGASGWLTISGGDGFYTAGDVNIKLGECIPISADTSVDYMWTTTDGNIIGDANQMTISVDKSGTYTVSVKDCKTCEGSDSVIVTMNETKADAGEDQVICKGDDAMLTATGGGTYLWSTGETTASIKVSPEVETTYSVTVTSDEGCEDTDEVVISLNPDVKADAGNDVAICKGEDVMLTATGGGTYLWSNGETTASITVSPTVDTTYSVTVTSNKGCEANDEVMVTVGDATADAGNDLEICKGDEVILTVAGDGTYLWSTGETSQSIEVSPENTTEYSVTVTNGNCEATDSVTVTVGYATADAGADQTICEGEEVILTVTGEGTYLWSTGEITPSITASPETTTEYSVIVTNGNCDAMDDVVVNVDDKVIIGDYVWLDENRNGIQDDGATGIESVSVQLYDCEGDLVDSTETNDDGSYQFKVCPDSGDYYIVFGEVPEGLKFTTSNEGIDTMDSDANASGVTACFTITDKDDLTIDAGLIEICDINLEVIEEVKMCGDQILDLTTALTDNTEECEGGCVYPIIEKGRCAETTPDNEVLLVSFANGKKFYHRFKASEQRFETFEDGSARYTATATDGVDNIEVDVTFTGHSTNPGPMGPKANICQEYDMSDWEYWSTWSGTISSQNHGIFTLSMKGAYFQMGIGADVTKSGFGASGWFFATGGDGFYVDGDINVALEECIEKSATFEWTTADGNIISDANQKTISIDKPGTYVIEATNCIDCVAVKKIVVTRDILCASFAKSSNSPKMMKVYPVPVQSGGTLTIEFDVEDNTNVSGLKATSLKAAVSGNPNKENVVVVLYDMTGRVVNTPRTFEIVDGKAVIYLDLDYMQTGKYIVKAMNGAWNDSKSIIVK